ncbi:phosphoserine aminotransferase [Heyndrickxia coagulans]|uniref:phosphoserine aminotransferase n=1 Tax=Heyndrickxia coagulans TaxID=1398 RepID=UPI001872231B|nr:phosphoserine aminotransferase [Heyndrickxia coagulans]
MIDNLKDISENLEDAQSAIAKYDVDGAISFSHTGHKGVYQGIYKDFKVLYDFAGKVGDIVDRTIDEPFYQDIDAFATAMRDLSITDVKTKNRIGAKETVVIPGEYGSNTMEVPKAEVTLEDLFSGSNAYAKQMKEEYDNWKLQNPDQEISEKDYEQAVLHSRAFQYDSIRDGQEKKEFWGQIASLAVIVGTSIICPPAGLALGIAYGTLELESAATGKDWISGRELGTGERVFRGVLAPLDIVPGVSGLSKFSSTVRLAHMGDVTELGLKAGLKAGIQRESRHVANMVIDARKDSAARIRSAKAWAKEVPGHLKHNMENGQMRVRKVGKVAKDESEIIPGRQMGLAAEGIGRVRAPAENTHGIENTTKAAVNKILKSNADRRMIKNISHPVLDNTRFGSALKKPDGQHGFNDIIDNYAQFADEFEFVGGDRVKRKLYQIEGGIKYYDYKDVYNKELRIKERITIVKDQNGIFEWIVDPYKGVTHRRFIPNGKITGFPNQRT